MTALRPYQQAAVDAVYEHLSTRADHPCVVLPTGSGKSLVLARICADVVERWNGRVLVLTHVKELVDQNATQASRFLSPLLVGVYSAGLRRRDTDHPVIVAGIQSVYQKACDLGRFDLAIIDEAHLIPPDGEGMYQTFFADARLINPRLRLVGLTATPFRMKDGPICAPGNLLNHTCYEIGVKELIQGGFLSPLMSKAGRSVADTSTLHIRAGEFVAGEVERLMDTDVLVASACAEIAGQVGQRCGILVFAAGVEHAQHVAERLRDAHGIETGCVFGHTPNEERDALIARFKRREVRALVNVGVLTTGFDAPHVDCVVLLRPTLSPGLYYQMVGRGFRLAPGKSDCLVLDFGGNVLRHGPVDALSIADPEHGSGVAPVKECPACLSLIAAGCLICPHCGHQFPPPERERHEPTASTAGILTGQATTIEYAVRSVSYAVHAKRGSDESAPKTLRVEYEIGWRRYMREWVCIEHVGFARTKAERWWRERSHEPMPSTATQACDLAKDGLLLAPTHITVRCVAGEYDRVVGYRFGERLRLRMAGADEDEPAFLAVGGDDEPPF